MGSNTDREVGGRLALRDQLIRVSIVGLLAFNVYFAAIEPCTSAEAVVYERYASRPMLQGWEAPLDPRLGVVYGALARLATRLGGVSELTIRIPSILGGLMFWIGLWSYCRRLRGWAGVAVFFIVAANPWSFRAFSIVSGAALAVGFLAMSARSATRSLRAACLLAALALGADVLIAVPALVLGAIAGALLKANVWEWVDEVLIPGILVGSVLLLPALLVHEQPEKGATDDRGTRQLIQTLRGRPHEAGPVRITASASLEPGLFFYRRRYHLDWLQISLNAADSKFFLLSPSDRANVDKFSLRTLQTVQGNILAER